MTSVYEISQIIESKGTAVAYPDDCWNQVLLALARIRLEQDDQEPHGLSSVVPDGDSGPLD